MVDTRELEQYLNDKSAREGDIVEITAGGDFELVDDANNPGKKKKVLNLPVLCNGHALLYTPGKKAMEALQAAWGFDTQNYVNKKFTVKFVVMMIKGEEKNVIKPVPMLEQKA